MLHAVANALSATLIAGVCQGLVLAVVACFCLRLLPRTSPALRFAVWTTVLLATMLLPLAEPSRHGSGHALFYLDARWSLMLAAVWVALSLVRAAGLTLHAVRLWSLRGNATPVVPPPAYAELLGGGCRRATLCTSTEVDRPCVVGFMAPRILIPAWLFEQLSQPELEQIVLHEVEHLRRGDDWLNLLQKLSLILFPLNPVLIWVERRLCFERELACDDGVLRRTRAPRAYASCLASLAERTLDRRGLMLALGALSRSPALTRRVQRILHHATPVAPGQATLACVALSLGLGVGAAGLGRCPQIVGFVTPASIDIAANTATAPAHVWTPSPNVRFADGVQPPPSLIAASLQVHRLRINRPHAHRTPFSKLGLHPPSARKPVLQLIEADPTASRRLVLLPYALVPSPDGWIIVQLMG